MNIPLNANLRDVIHVKEDISQRRNTQQDCRGGRQENGVEVCLASWLRGRHANWLKHDVLYPIRCQSGPRCLKDRFRRNIWRSHTMAQTFSGYTTPTIEFARVVRSLLKMLARAL